MRYPSGSYTLVKPSYVQGLVKAVSRSRGLAYIFQAMLVGFSILGRYRFVGERYSGKLVVVVMIPDVLDIFEDRIQVVHSLTVEETYLSDEIL